jgi:hypothetical protein
MTAELETTERDESAGEYVGWGELRRRVSPRLGRDRFRALIDGKIARAGFPPFREEWGGFYWPKVRRWLDSDNGVEADGFAEEVQDGPENFDAAPKRQAGVQARPPRVAVLDRKTGGERPQGVPRRLHSVASRS